MGFAASEFLSQEFVLRNVYANADSFERAIVNDGSTDETNVPNFIVWSLDTLGDIKSRSLDKHSLHQRWHRLAILWMDE
jgi:hypothetical protein